MVVEADHEADGDFVAVEVVEEGAAVGFVIERPAGAVEDEARAGVFGLDFPDFFDADAVGLRLAVFIEAEAADELFGKRASAAFGKQGLLGAEFHAGLEVVGGLAVFADAHVAGGDAFDAAVGVVEQFGGGEAGVDFHAEGFGLFGQPAGEQAEADDVVAFVAETGGGGEGEGVFFGEEEDAVFADAAGEGRAGFAPVGQKFGEGFGVDDRAGEDVRAHFRAFFDDADADVAAVFLCELFEADGGGEAGGAGADDEHVVVHAFAFDGGGVHVFVFYVVCCGVRPSENGFALSDGLCVYFLMPSNRRAMMPSACACKSGEVR